jgi:hypothetical protein
MRIARYVMDPGNGLDGHHQHHPPPGDSLPPVD